MKCSICGSTINVSSQPTRSQLLFGGFRGRMTEPRCEKCEKKISEWVVNKLKGLENDK